MPGVVPCLIRAYFSWIEDSSLTPYLLFNTSSAGVLSIYAKENGEGKMFDNKKTNKKIKTLALKF